MNAKSTRQVSPLPLRDENDDALLRLRSSAATGELYRRHASAVRKSLARRVSPDDAEDIAQSTFIVLLSDPRFVPARGRLRPWLCGIARRLAAKRRGLLVQESLVNGEGILCDDPWLEERDEESEVGVNE